jgi:ankyrin repeat protein
MNYFLSSRVNAWLKPSDTSSNLVSASQLRHPDTGRWFLESDNYKWLKSNLGARLWLRGIPGSGKTVLSSTIIENLKLSNQTPGAAVVYFFFSFSDESKQKLDHMLRSLVSQLVLWAKPTNNPLLKLYESSSHGHEQPRMSQLVETFNQIASELQDVTVVLDALDECRDRGDLLRWITSSSNQDYKFILTSRSERDIEEFFASWVDPDRIITLGSDLVADDIEAYVHYRLETEENLSRWKLMHEEIASTIVGKAAGMFRWVDCQLQELSMCIDKPSVRRMLRTLPTDLYETYDRILQNIPDARVPNAIKLLQLLTFSKRPMRLEEVVDAVATELDMQPPFDTENRITPPDAIIGYCSSLVRITTSNTRTLADGKSPFPGERKGKKEAPRIQLAHFSVRQYLLLDRHKNPYHHRFEEKSGNSAVAQIYLSYLWTAANFPKDYSETSDFPLARHAARHWLEHARIAGDSDNLLFRWMLKLFKDHKFVRYWSSIHRPDWDKEPGQLPTEPALYYASLAGLCRTVRYQLDCGVDVNSTGNGYDNALQAAAKSGSIETVQLLLDHGAKVNFGDGSRQNAISSVVETENIELLQLILNRGAHGDAKNLEQGYPMHAATDKCNLAIVRILLGYGADVNARRHGDEYALHIAAKRGFTELVQMLLSFHAIVDSRDQHNKTALHRAAEHGHKEVVQVLLKHNANVNAHDSRGNTALHMASSFGHVEVVGILIEHFANVDDPNGDNDTALEMASSRGHKEVLQMLLKHGAYESTDG